MGLPFVAQHWPRCATYQALIKALIEDQRMKTTAFTRADLLILCERSLALSWMWCRGSAAWTTLRRPLQTPRLSACGTANQSSHDASWYPLENSSTP